MRSVPLFGEDNEEPHLPCDFCGERLAQHFTMREGKDIKACCYCWIYKMDGVKVDWHKECPVYYMSRYGLPAKEGTNLIVIRSGSKHSSG